MGSENFSTGFYRWPEIQEMFGFCRNVWNRDEKKGIYPNRHKITGKLVGWRKSDIHKLIEYICKNGHPPPPGYWF